MKIMLDEGAFMPTRAHKADAGLDLRSREYGTVPAYGSKVFHTGVHIQIPEGKAGLLVSKSGLNVKRDITSTGLIDEGYTGEIIVKLINHSDIDYHVKKGDKISQLVILRVYKDILEVVDKLEENTERGNNGFGSTGR